MLRMIVFACKMPGVNDIKYYLIYEQSALSDINLISDKARIVSILNSIKNDPF